MKVLLHLTFADIPEISFYDPLTAWVKTAFPSVTCFDLDNHSESMLIHYAISLLEKAEKIIMVISISKQLSPETLSLGNLSKLISQLIRTKNKPVKLLLDGKFPLLEKMAKTTMDNNSLVQISDKTQWKKEITQFFDDRTM